MAGTQTISEIDNGMTKVELAENLGTPSNTGTKAFGQGNSSQCDLAAAEERANRRLLRRGPHRTIPQAFNALALTLHYNAEGHRVCAVLLFAPPWATLGSVR